MKAVAFSEFGGPEVLRLIDKEIPRAKGDQVVVKVVCSSVNPTDIMMRDGRQADLMADLSPPYIPGFEFAGYINSVGRGVVGVSVDQPVMGIVNARRAEGGAHAEYVCVPAASVAPLASGGDFAEAATIAMNGLAAKVAVETLGLPQGSTVLVTGGAGVVGGFAIQLAKEAGLAVLADAFASDVELLRSMGSDKVVPRSEEMGAAIRQLFPKGVDGLIDTALIGDRASAFVRDGGVAVSLRRSHPINDPRLETRYMNVFAHATDTASLVRLSKLYHERVIAPRIALRLPYTDAAKAHRMVESGELDGQGRVVLTFADEFAIN